MGYTTDFIGKFSFNKELDHYTHDLLVGLATTRRMARYFENEEYGADGEFYCEDRENFGQNNHHSIMNRNRPPSTQPSLWLQWIPTEDGLHLEWDGNEKFYSYVEWLQYLIDRILEPRGYKLNGKVTWQGEESNDMGQIDVVDNKITVKHAVISYV
jgi:hypothetical protein